MASATRLYFKHTFLYWLAAVIVGFGAAPAQSATLAEMEKAFRQGKYEECLEAASKETASGAWHEGWYGLQIRCQMMLGKHEDALKTLDAGLKRHVSSIELRWLGREVCLYNQQTERASILMEEIASLVERAYWRYSDAASRVTLGRFFLLRGNDARKVLELYYDRAKKDRADWAGSQLASGELALEKNDYALAADSFQAGLKIEPGNPDLHYGLARALAPSDGEAAEASLEKALDLNPRHIDSLLFQADRRIDAERYEIARERLDKALAINPRHARAWAYRAVLAHLQSDAKAEREAREKALAHWKTNPEVDHLMGRKLSQEYRFAEGAAHQREALKFDPVYLPAKAQLSQDLMRLGEEEQGWKLADEVLKLDGYNVMAHNLVELSERLAKFSTIEEDGFLVRMDAREREIYGQTALDLLKRAKAALCSKYEVNFSEPIVVEIFPRQDDFAIRTFGLPGGAGYLGVCFGRVITANSPASQGEDPSNWQAVLWHEFCHVVTLHKTSNKMPRWLSEGISVYEERQANAAWGQWMTPIYRKMILGSDLVPVSRLSGAFLNPPGGLHLQFAYYESSLVVEYFVERYGIEALKKVLVDLGVGMPINDALARHAGSIEILDREFADYARQQAERLAPQADWTDLPDEATDLESLDDWLKEHPNSFEALRRRARLLLEAKEWDRAIEAASAVGELCPTYVGADNAYEMLAEAYRELNHPEAERAVLRVLTALAGDDAAPRLRLADLCRKAEDWPATREAALAAAAVQPLATGPHQALAEAAEKLGQPDEAIAARRALLALGPSDIAQAHYDLARLLAERKEWPQAKRQALMALEEAPRFREAQRLLLSIVEQAERGEADESKPKPKEEIKAGR